MELIGNTPEESAYHEAGHIVIAAVVGLDLRPAGIILFETDSVAGGIACYWEDSELEPVLKALRAGQQAQLKQFPGSEIRGGQGDVQTFFAALKELQINRRGEMWQQISNEVAGLLSKHWPAVVEVATALLSQDSRPIDTTDTKYLSPEEQILAKSKKRLVGDDIVAILQRHGISARVRK
ncbi:MAG: hypothetical protein WCA13_21395 [Terriglobales bacterium]